jgi:FixJ family two-component response regulator
MGIGAIKRGAVDFLPKPFSDDELFSAVAQALARSAEDWRQRGEVVESRARLAKLTTRELAVFRLVIAGLLNKESYIAVPSDKDYPLHPALLRELALER